MKQKDNFIWLRIWWLMLQGLSVESRDRIVCAVNAYVFEGVEPTNLQPMESGLFMAIRFGIDEANAKYEATCKKRSDAGKRGAAVTNEIRWSESQQNHQMPTNDELDENLRQNRQTSAKSSKSADNDYILNNNLDNISFFLQHPHARENEERKKEILIEIGKKMLRRGSTEPKKESDAFWEYNKSTGWMKGKVKQTSITDPVAWADKWKMQYPTDVNVAKWAPIFIDIMRAAHVEDDFEILDGVAELKLDGQTVHMIFKTEYAMKRFVKAEDNKDFVSRMRTVFDIHYPHGAGLNYSVKK